MNPITINLNVNLQEKQVEWICSAIACLAQIVIDHASRPAGTPFPPAQVANDRNEPAAETQQKTENAAETQQNTAQDDAPTAPQRTKKELQNLVIEITQAGKKAEAAEIVHRYAKKVSEIPTDKIDEAYAALKKLLEGNDGTDA